MAGTIHVQPKAAAKLTQQAVKNSSYILSNLSKDYDFKGAKSIQILTAETQPMNDYKRSGTNRYGEPKEVQDFEQILTLTQDKSFSLTIDKGNNNDQNYVKTKGKAVLKAQIGERAIPEEDKYTFERLSQKAGKITGASAITAENVLDRIMSGTEHLDNKGIPTDNRYLYVNASTYKFLKLSGSLLGVETLAKEAISKGVVAAIDAMPVIKVPESRWPSKVNFLIVHRDSAVAPQVINDTKLHLDPPGISGDLLEGRFNYDAFVIGSRCDGVYADVKEAPLKAPTISATNGAMSGASGGTYHWTIDGSDPRYSSSVQVGPTATGMEVGDIIKCYVTQAGKFDSPVAEIEYTGA